MEITLGATYRDTVFGTTGVAMTHSRHFTGCDMVRLEWKKTSEGNEGKTDDEWIDVTRLELLEAHPVIPQPGKSVETAEPDIGGPQAHPPARR